MLIKIGPLIFVIVLIALAALLMANVEMPEWSHVPSVISAILFAIPCLWAARRWLGWRDAILLFIILGVYALAVETAALATGFPYGQFAYSDRLGYKLFGVVPWMVAIAWTPLLLGAYSVAANLFESRTAKILSTTLVLLAFDLVIDPGAVRLGFWQFAQGGWYYGVPLSNFGGWLLSGFVGAILLEIVVSRLRPPLHVPIQLAASALLTIFFWTVFAVSTGMLLPIVVGTAILTGLVVIWYKFYYSFDDRIVLVDENNVAIGTAAKLAAHNSETKLHRAFSVFIFNKKGELLLQQRALSKKTWPGVWSNSCCGHVMLHESTRQAAARRLKKELGLVADDLSIVLPNFRYRAERDGVVENEICPVLVGTCDSDPSPDPSEVADYRWIDWHDFVSSSGDAGIGLSPWAVEEVRLLIASETFREWFSDRVLAEVPV